MKEKKSVLVQKQALKLFVQAAYCGLQLRFKMKCNLVVMHLRLVMAAGLFAC